MAENQKVNYENKNVLHKKDYIYDLKEYYAFDYYKVILTFIVVFYHYNYARGLSIPYLFPGGSLCVDTFFVISGFLFQRSVEQKKGMSVFGFIIYRMKTIGIHYYIALIFSLIPYLKKGIYFSSDVIIELIEEILMVQEWGIYRSVNEINGVAWYISAMLACYILLFIINKYLSKSKKMYVVINVFLL